MKTFTADVTQYLRPNGRRKQEITELPIEYEEKYKEMLKRGWNFGAEVLTTGHVSVTIEDRVEGRDVTIRVIKNGPEVQKALCEMLEEI